MFKRDIIKNISGRFEYGRYEQGLCWSFGQCDECVGCAFAQGKDTLPEIEDYITAHANDHQALADLICEQVQDHKYIFLADTNHGNKKFRAVLGSPAVLQAIRDCVEGSAVVLEGPSSNIQKRQERLEKYKKLENSYQELVNEQEIYKEQLEVSGLPDDEKERLQNKVARLKALFDMNRAFLHQSLSQDTSIILADHFGVSAHYYDTGYDIAPEDMYAVRILSQTYTQSAACSAIRMLYQAQSDAPDPGQYFRDIERFILQRIENDNTDIAHSILTNHPNGAFIFYGSGHLDGRHDLDDMVGVDEAVTTFLEDRSNSDGEVKRFSSKRLGKLMPEFVNLKRDDTGDAYYNVTTQTTRSAQAQDGPHEEDTIVISRDTFDECRADMPDSVRDAFIDAKGVDFTYEDYEMLMDPDQGMPEIIADWAPPGYSAP